MERIVTKILIDQSKAINISEDITTRLNGIFETLKVDEGQSSLMFATVAFEMLADNEINWGRILILLSFARLIVKELKGEEATTFANFTSAYLKNKVGEWIEVQGGWSLLENFWNGATIGG